MHAIKLRLAAGAAGVLILLACGATTAAACGPLSAPRLSRPAQPVPPATTTTVGGAVEVRATYGGLFGPVSAFVQVEQNNAQVGPNLPLSLGSPDGAKFPVYGAVDTRLLADGPYALVVVVNTACGQATAEVRLLVDNVDPSLSFSAGPASGAVIANAVKVSFGFVAADATTSLTFQCSYDSAPLATCVSPTPATTLKPGKHGFRVVATDTLGNSSTIMRTFSVAAPPPRCHVPQLRGLTLSAARAKLRKAHCLLGPVRRPSRRVLAVNRGQQLVVQRQTVTPGSTRPGRQSGRRHARPATSARVRLASGPVAAQIGQRAHVQTRRH